MPTPREVWSAGDWPSLSKLIVAVGETTAAAADVGPGDTALDVGAGDGNVAIPLAKSGARVTALDPTPELFESGRARATEAGVEIEWVEGDAMDLPYEDGSFDVVTSNFGAMFAPDHGRAAAELTRVGRRVVMTTWDFEGMNGQMFVAVAPFMPPPPEGAQPPPLWGVEEHVRECFAPTGREVTIERDTAPTPTFESVDAYTDWFMRVLGPLDLARPALEADGRWDDVRAAVRGNFERFNEASDGTFRASPSYFRISA
jgi:ubiquinone/menaquinone biosynthesis C-methylase UbiE